MLLLGVLLVSFHLASSSSEFPLARRNVFRRQMTDCSINPILSNVCIPQYGQPLVNDAAECGFHTLVQSYLQLCSINSNGQSCYEIDDASEDNAEEQCSSPRDLQNCTSGCRHALLAYHSDFGCCVNVDNDFIDSDELWSSCGVDKPGLCEGSTLESPEVNEEQVCSEEEGEIMFYKDLVCGGESGQAILEDFATCFGRVTTDLYLYNLCGEDENGQICYEAVVSGEIEDDIGGAIVICFLNAGSLACCSALHEVQSDYGCCAYNEIGDEIWSVCGLEAPGLCNHTVFVNTATNNVPFVLALHILAVFAYMMV